MAATGHAIQAARCELCGGPAGDGIRDRVAHLRKEHPAYGRGLLLRVAAPGVFLVAMLALGALRAPQWGYMAALGLSFGLLFFGKIRSRLERTRAGARATIGVKRLVREGGLAFVLVIPAVAGLILLLGRG